MEFSDAAKSAGQPPEKGALIYRLHRRTSASYAMMGQLLAVVLTIIGEVGVFVLGQLILKFVIEPLRQYKETKGDVSHAVHYYANVGG